MEKNYIEDKAFNQVDFTTEAFEKADYENCHFSNCNFSNTDLSKINFTDCTFTGCNLSMAKLGRTGFKDCIFNDCKLLGLRFEDCHEFLFSIHFNNCQLNLASFYNRKCKNIRFTNCILHEVDLTEADCTDIVFDNCDMARAIFSNTILEKADLRTSYNYSIDPETNRIRKAKFSLPAVIGLLDKYNLDIE